MKWKKNRNGKKKSSPTKFSFQKAFKIGRTPPRQSLKQFDLSRFFFFSSPIQVRKEKNYIYSFLSDISVSAERFPELPQSLSNKPTCDSDQHQPVPRCQSQPRQCWDQTEAQTGANPTALTKSHPADGPEDI